MRRTPLFLPPTLPPPPPCRDGHMQFIMQKHPRAAGVGGQEGRYRRCSVSFQHQQVLKVPDSEKYIFLCCCAVFQHLYTPRLLFYFDEDRLAGKLKHNVEYSVHIKNQRLQNLCACDGLIWSIVNSPLQGANRRVVTSLLQEIFSKCFIWILTPRSRTTL